MAILFHGDLFEFLRNDAFDAKNYFQTGPAPIHLNQFGGSISGPIVKDKLFFFFNYEGVRQVTHSPTGPGGGYDCGNSRSGCAGYGSSR